MDYFHGYRRRLPHFRGVDKAYFVTFRSAYREDLPEEARDIALDSCIHEHQESCWLDSVVIMPNHGHLVLVPYSEWTLEKIMMRVKRVSSHRIKQVLRISQVWEREYFDHMLRSDESMRRKSEYVALNPVRAGFVNTPDEWQWLWRSWVEGISGASRRCDR
jgi:REP element-mobilizing transposase RayT